MNERRRETVGSAHQFVSHEVALHQTLPLHHSRNPQVKSSLGDCRRSFLDEQHHGFARRLHRRARPERAGSVEGSCRAFLQQGCHLRRHHPPPKDDQKSSATALRTVAAPSLSEVIVAVAISVALIAADPDRPRTN